uniref:Uncharacterized protein n=1 Tax=Ditylenchus dipsaci TaxID=166011 RepID=A0A915DSW1_9BILA
MMRKNGQPVCMWHQIVRSPPKTSLETAQVDKEVEEAEKEDPAEVKPVAPAPLLITEMIEEEKGSVES